MEKERSGLRREGSQNDSWRDQGRSQRSMEMEKERSGLRREGSQYDSWRDQERSLRSMEMEKERSGRMRAQGDSFRSPNPAPALTCIEEGRDVSRMDAWRDQERSLRSMEMEKERSGHMKAQAMNNKTSNPTQPQIAHSQRQMMPPRSNEETSMVPSMVSPIVLEREMHIKENDPSPQTEARPGNFEKLRSEKFNEPVRYPSVELDVIEPHGNKFSSKSKVPL
mmetsp:Transcript_4962/g.6381  ORF Transcript_4962/g.6381 Transcript_4962/m.6381 type:complete len:223 (-) Transcript_4962:289-957(-)